MNRIAVAITGLADDLFTRRGLKLFYAAMRGCVRVSFYVLADEAFEHLQIIGPDSLHRVPGIAVARLRGEFELMQDVIPAPEFQHIVKCLDALLAHLDSNRPCEDTDPLAMSAFVFPSVSFFTAAKVGLWERMTAVFAEAAAEDALAEDRVKRYQAFGAAWKAKHKRRMTQSAFAQAAMVDPRDLRRWLSATLPDDSAMSARIEQVLSGAGNEPTDKNAEREWVQ